MKAKLLTLSMQYLLIVAMMFLLLPVSVSQMVDAAAVDPDEYFERMKALEPDPPVFFTTRTGLGPAEFHVLDTLTNQERQLIEMEVNPPAVGIIRDLRPSIYFNLTQTEIPIEGEVSVSGGRLGWINEDTLVFTTHIGSQKADEIRVFFAEGNFPHGVMVNLFSENDYAFTQVELRGQIDEYGFYTTTTFADHVIIQVVIPSEVIKDDLYFEITKVVHVDNRYLPEDYRACTLDANCSTANSFAGIDGLRRSTGRLLFPIGSLYYFCTGNQINDARAKDWQPFLLTANHCFSTQTSAAGLEARFYYWSTSCNSGVINPSHIIRNGANLIATNSQTDFTLVLMKQFSANYFLGWNVNAVANNTVLHSTHHPGGTLLKYQRMLNKTSPDFTCTGFSTANYHYTQTTHGRSAGGSSGSAVVDADLRIRGQLYGWCFLAGADECSYNTYYNMWGRFNVTYANNNLQYWLNNGGASVAMSTSPVSSQNYGNVNVGSVSNLTVTVTNTGTRPNFMNLEAGNATITGTNANQFSIIGSNFLYLAPGESGTFTVRFTPTSAGTKTATLTIPHNADNITSPRTISLTGAGVSAPNPCADIISLDSGGSANARTFSKSGSGAWNVTACGWNTPGPEQVYSFVAPYTGNYSIQVTATNGNYVDYFWKSGSCSSTGWNCIADIISPGVFGNIALTAGVTYYILLDSEVTTLATQTFFIFFNPCQNITSIAGAGAANTQTYMGGGSGAWNTTTQSACEYICPGVENIYSFTPSVTGNYSVEVTAASGWVNYMWKSGACNSENWECIADLSSPGVYGSMPMTAGTTYLILLDDENSTPGTHQFFIREPLLPGTWIGTVSTNWHTPANWSDGVVPTATTNVTIPAGTPFIPVVSSPATCNFITVKSGANLTISGNGLTVLGSLYVEGTLTMSNSASLLTVGQSFVHFIEFKSGSTAVLNNGTINCFGWLIPRDGSTFNPSNDVTIYFKGNSGGGPSNFSPSATYGNIVIEKNADQIAYFDLNATQPLVVNGNFSISANNKFALQNKAMSVAGVFINNSTSEIYLAQVSKSDLNENTSGKPDPDDQPVFRGGLLEIDTDFTLNGLLNVADGDVLVHGRFASTSTSSILINGGTFISDAPNHGDKGWQYLNGNLTMPDGLFEITHNSVNFGTTASTIISGGTIKSGGAFYAVTAGVFQPTGGVVEIIGNQPDNAIYCNSPNHFHNLTIDRTGSFSQIITSSVLVQNDLIVDNGELRFSGILSAGNSVEINSGAKLLVSGTAKLQIGSSGTVTVNNGGILEFDGTSFAQPATLSRISTGNYALNVESGGTLAARNTVFEYMNTNGVHIKAGAIVDATKAFTNSTFRNGQSGGRLLTIHNNQTFEVVNADFPANTWGGSYNVYKNVNQGNVTFTGYTGPFSGSAFEFDPNNRIHWTLDAFTLTFTVNDSHGNSVSDAVVTLNGTSYPAGTYVFNDLAPGLYNYSISRSCYQTATGQVNIVAANVTEAVVLTNIPGDANNDGVVNVSDVVVIVNYYMGESPSPFCFNNADVNNDGVINVQDVVGTVNIFMSGKMDPWIELNSSVAYMHLNGNGISVESDGTLAGIQFELSGLKLEEMELISRLPGHAMTYKVVDGNLRVLIFSIDNTPIPAGNIPLVDFKNTAENLQWGDAAAANLNADAVEVILLTEPLGWRNADAPEGLRVYPNPVKDVLWVEFHNHSGKPAQVTLSNMHAQQITAQKVIEQGDIMVSFKMNELAPGVYFIRVDIDGKYFYEKIIVN